MERLNDQGSKELNQFQKLIVQNMYIKKLNLWLDELNWENEKKDAIIEMHENEIDNQRKITQEVRDHLIKTENEFKKYIRQAKEVKKDKEKHGKQQEIIDDLRKKLETSESRLRTQHRMNELLLRQQAKT